MARTSSEVNILNSLDQEINPATEDKQDDVIIELQKLVGFEIPEYDYIALTYVESGVAENEIETVTYKVGGSSGDVVATLTLSYNGDGNLSAVTKT